MIVTKHRTDFLELHHCLNVLLRENIQLRLTHLKITSFYCFISYSKDGIGAPFMGSLAECEYACLLFPTYSYTLIRIIRQRMLLLDCIMILDHITGFLI